MWGVGRRMGLGVKDRSATTEWRSRLGGQNGRILLLWHECKIVLIKVNTDQIKVGWYTGWWSHLAAAHKPAFLLVCTWNSAKQCRNSKANERPTTSTLKWAAIHFPATFIFGYSEWVWSIWLMRWENSGVHTHTHTHLNAGSSTYMNYTKKNHTIIMKATLQCTSCATPSINSFTTWLILVGWQCENYFPTGKPVAVPSFTEHITLVRLKKKKIKGLQS